MQDASSQCEALLRAGDRDRFLAALFAPAEHRGAILALYAFNLEIARVREVVREPLAGEIRLQWWSDVLGGEPRGEAQGHPVVAALLAAVAKYRLDKARLLALIEARRFDLFNEPMLTMADFEKYADAAAGGLMSLCAQILITAARPAPASSRIMPASPMPSQDCSAHLRSMRAVVSFTCRSSSCAGTARTGRSSKARTPAPRSARHWQNSGSLRAGTLNAHAS